MILDHPNSRRAEITHHLLYILYADLISPFLFCRRFTNFRRPWGRLAIVVVGGVIFFLSRGIGCRNQETGGRNHLKRNPGETISVSRNLPSVTGFLKRKTKNSSCYLCLGIFFSWPFLPSFSSIKHEEKGRNYQPEFISLCCHHYAASPASYKELKDLPLDGTGMMESDPDANSAQKCRKKRVGEKILTRNKKKKRTGLTWNLSN